MADIEFMSPEEVAARKRKPLQEQLSGVAPVTASSIPFTPSDQALSRKLLLNQGETAASGPAESAAPPLVTTSTSASTLSGPQKEPSAAGQTPGSSPPSQSQVGGVSNTVAQTQSEVNDILGRKPSAKKLRDAVEAYESAAAGLKEQSADTSSIDAALAEARKGYEEKVNRNEMLSLVQMIAQGFAKLAAYQYGAGQGRYIADQVNVPTIDYEKRSDRAAEDYKQSSLETRDLRRSELDKADKRYQMEKDKVGSLRERIGAEESALGRETSMYGDELSAARARQSDATREQGADKRDQSLEEKFNRQFGAKEVDNVQEEERILRQKEQAVTALAGAVSSDDKRSRAAIPALAAKAGVDPAEVEKFRSDTEKKGIIWDSDDPKAAAEAMAKSLLPGVRERLDALRKRKEAATEMMRTGESLEQVRSRLESGGAPAAAASTAPQDKKPTPEQIAEYKRRNPSVPEDVAIKTMTDRLNGR